MDASRWSGQFFPSDAPPLSCAGVLGPAGAGLGKVMMVVNSPVDRLAILGAGGHGRVVADCAAALGWKEIRLFDERPGADLGPWGRTEPLQRLFETLDAYDGVIAAIGSNASRWVWHERLRSTGAAAPVLVHPRAVVSAHAELGPGTVVLAGAVVNIGARLGAAVIINTGASVDHDCRIGDAVHLSPAAALAGGVSVGDLAWIGIGAVVKEGISVGRRAIVGAAAAVVHPVADGVRVVGVPARVMAGKKHA